MLKCQNLLIYFFFFFMDRNKTVRNMVDEDIWCTWQVSHFFFFQIFVMGALAGVSVSFSYMFSFFLFSFPAGRNSLTAALGIALSPVSAYKVYNMILAVCSFKKKKKTICFHSFLSVRQWSLNKTLHTPISSTSNETGKTKLSECTTHSRLVIKVI